MNLMSFLKSGAKHAPTEGERAQARVTKAAEQTRIQWLDALLVDQTRAWMSIGQHEAGVIEGMTTMLAIAGFAHVFDARSADTPDLRVIRGAISAAGQCVRNGSVVLVDDARAFSSAAARAKTIIETASVDAILHAATEIRKTVGL